MLHSASRARDGKRIPIARRPLALICLGGIPWVDSWKRNQSMVYELSKLPLFDRVVFVNPRDVWVKDQLITGPGTFRHRVQSIIRSFPRRYDRKIRICSMFRLLPMKQHLPWAQHFEEKVFASTIRWLRGNRPTVLLNNHPHFFAPRLLDEFHRQAILRVFDLSDDFVEFHRIEAHRRASEASLANACSHADVVLAVNEHVKDKYAHFNANIYVIPNATNFDNFHRDAYRPVAFLEGVRARGPVFGYTGIINSIRVDYTLVETLASSRPDYQFVFIGSADPSFHSIVERHPNIHYHPWVSYEQLPDCIRYFNAAIIPFRVNEHTQGNDLLKFNDYLAMGMPIVTTDMGGARKYEGLLWIASDPAQFLAGIDVARHELSSPEIRRRRVDMAARNSWRHRAMEVQDIFLKHLPPEVGHPHGKGRPC